MKQGLTRMLSCALWLVLVSACGGSGNTNSNNADAKLMQFTIASGGGGGIKQSNPAIVCDSSCTSQVERNVSINLTAVPDEEHEFLNWQGPPNCASELQCTVVTGQTNNVTATFVKVTKYKLTVQLAGNGSVTSSPSGITCGTDCTQSYAQGRNVTLTATPSNGYQFSGWSGSNINCPGTGNCSITMNSATTVKANFTLLSNNVTVSVAVSGSGQVNSNPGNIACPGGCSATLPNGSTINLTAIPAAKFQFSGWTGDAASCGNTNTCSLKVLGNMQIGALFTSTSSGSRTRVSVSGMGHIGSSDQSISCGSVPNILGNSRSSDCVKALPAGLMTFTATPYNDSFKFDRWTGACSGNTPTCTVDVSSGQRLGAIFVPVTSTTDVCTAMGLKSDKLVYKLDASFPALTVGQSFADPKFGTTIRRVTDVLNDGRGSNKVLKTMYSTVSAWNADETYLILYRTDGTAATHELFDGKTYQFIRKLDDIDPVDLEQIYWDTSDPDILYYANRTYNNLYRYRVSTRAKEVLHNFDAQCTSGTELHGGSDPLFNSWDSKKFGFACAPNGKIFTYDVPSNTLGKILASTYDYGAPQATPSGTQFFVNENNSNVSNRPATVRDANLNILRTIDIASADEHGALSMLSNGHDTWNAVAFDSGPNGSGTGTLVQFNLNTGATRVIVGESNGYPYPPSGTHVGATAFHRTGLVAVSIKDDLKGDSLLDNELLFVDTDLVTNPKSAVCRVGHHRTKSDDYWAEPHPVMSPSGTRILFSSSWGDSRSSGEVVNVYVVELPGYKK